MSWRSSARWCAAISAAFCVAMVVWLVAMAAREHFAGPMASLDDMLRVKKQVQENPSPESVAAFRAADERLRADYFLRQQRMKLAGYSLLGGAIVLTVSLKAMRRMARKAPSLDEVVVPTPERGGLWGVVGGAGVVAALFACGAVGAAKMRSAASLVPKQTVASIPVPTIEVLRENWPVFRGWGGAGQIMGQYAATWDGAKGTNILWKAELPREGQSSPVVWGDRVFVTGGDEQSREVTCFSVTDGARLWSREVPATVQVKFEVNEDTGFAAPTPAVDGTHVYAIFPTGDLVALDFAGNKVWQKYIGRAESSYGYASSLTLAGGKVIVQWDSGKDEKKADSALIAFDGATGKEVWRTPRPVMNGWGSPIVTGDGKAIVTAGNPWVIAYEAASGAEIWRAKLLGDDVACTPNVVDGVAWIANDRAVVAGVLMSSRGDVSESVVWKTEEGVPDIVSPTSDGKHVWTITASGTLFCFDARTGNKVYEAPLEASLHGSPAVVGDTLWITDQRGVTRVVATGPAYKELGRASIGEKVSASLAFSRGKVFIRGSKHLFCVSAGK